MTALALRSRVSWTAVLLVLFVAGEVYLVLARLGGPTRDEGIYTTAGLRTLDGAGISDGYLTWFAGSLLWPTLAGVAHSVGGFEAARLLALAFVTVAVVAVARAGRNLLGRETHFWTTLAAVSSGPLLALAHLAVYDVIALAGVAVAFWALTELARRDDRRWLALASLSFGVAVLAKYPTLFFGGVPLVAILVALRRGRLSCDLGIFAFATAAIVGGLFLLERGQLSSFLTLRPGQNADFGLSLEQIGYGVAYYSIATALLAVAGWLALGGRRGLGAALLVGLLIPPAYHLGVGGSIGDHKHVVFGLLFAFPLAGLALHRAWSMAPARLVVAPGIACLAVFGVLQMERVDNVGPELSASVAFLEARVQRGERLLANNSWPYALTLYDRGLVSSPNQVYDTYRVGHGQAPVPLCAFDWFVEDPGASPWPKDVRRRIEDCGTFVQVYWDRHRLTGLGPDLKFATYSAYSRVWRNTATQ